MRIQSADIQFTQRHNLERSEQRSNINVDQPRSPTRQPNTLTLPIPPLTAAHTHSTAASSLDNHKPTENEPLSTDLNTQILKSLVEALIGKKIEVGNIKNSEPATGEINTQAQDLSFRPQALRQDNVNNSLATTVVQINEYEYSNVSINAQIKGSQNQSLDIQLSITMERRFQQLSITTQRAEENLTDPLVINFNGDNVQLSTESHHFDLNSDGIKEWLPSLISDSAYVALDRNNDGIINNGQELFGPTTGSGFDELSKFDEDGNQFIDANDSIYSQLLAYNPQTESIQTLSSLNIDVLYLGSIHSPFRLTDSNNNTLGEIRSTGFYIDNQGQAGVLQQVDLNV